uniref:Uncharacterized protein n=1 Tax=Anguilla anguilla TaxID=7936 RepID=A0A0E9S0W1_ANGAN
MYYSINEYTTVWIIDQANDRFEP